ncbi:MAG: hypothetical protein U5K79_08485 [Cyclobacteriaceae bacterium]|nr:hypothetical protein [Cyclobacteriaceae bacterium]
MLGHTLIETISWDEIKTRIISSLVYSIVEGHTSVAASGNEVGIIQEVFLGGMYFTDGSIENG